MGVTERIAHFVVETRHESISEEAISLAKTAILDCLGVTLAGSKEECARICGLLVREEAAKNESTVIGQGFRSSASMAAFANGTAAHALDYDHSFALMGQPTAALIPAIFPLAEALHTDGRHLLLAYVIGFEVTGKLARSIPDHMSRGGWHSTGTLGSLGATAACAKLLGLDAGAAQVALGIASSMASGMVSNFGSMTKPLHAGLASRNGVLAAKLAQNGFTANSMILERPKGFFEVYCRDLSYDPAPMESLGASLELVDRGIRIKPYPCGGLTHSAIDALLEMRARYDIAPESIEAIKVGVTQQTYNMLASYVGVPESGLQGKFSMPYVLARALIDGKVSLDAFTDEAVQNASVREMAEKIYMEYDPELNEGEKGGRPARVVIRLKDGGTLSQRVDYPKGSKEAPLSPQAVHGKFMECAMRAISKEAASQVVEYLGHLEEMDDLEPLYRLLIGENKE